MKRLLPLLLITACSSMHTVHAMERMVSSELRTVMRLAENWTGTSCAELVAAIPESKLTVSLLSQADAFCKKQLKGWMVMGSLFRMAMKHTDPEKCKSCIENLLENENLPTPMGANGIDDKEYDARPLDELIPAAINLFKDQRRAFDLIETAKENLLIYRGEETPPAKRLSFIQEALRKSMRLPPTGSMAVPRGDGHSSDGDDEYSEAKQAARHRPPPVAPSAPLPPPGVVAPYGFSPPTAPTMHTMEHPPPHFYTPISHAACVIMNNWQPGKAKVAFHILLKYRNGGLERQYQSGVLPHPKLAGPHKNDSAVAFALMYAHFNGIGIGKNRAEAKRIFLEFREYLKPDSSLNSDDGGAANQLRFVDKFLHFVSKHRETFNVTPTQAREYLSRIGEYYDAREAVDELIQGLRAAGRPAAAAGASGGPSLQQPPRPVSVTRGTIPPANGAKAGAGAPPRSRPSVGFEPQADGRYTKEQVREAANCIQSKANTARPWHKAIPVLEWATLNGYPKATFTLGFALWFGRGISPDKRRASKLWQSIKAIITQSTEQQIPGITEIKKSFFYRLALAYHEKYLETPDRKGTVIKLLRKAQAAGNITQACSDLLIFLTTPSREVSTSSRPGNVAQRAGAGWVTNPVQRDDAGGRSRGDRLMQPPPRPALTAPGHSPTYGHVKIKAEPDGSYTTQTIDAAINAMKQSSHQNHAAVCKALKWAYERTNITRAKHMYGVALWLGLGTEKNKRGAARIWENLELTIRRENNSRLLQPFLYRLALAYHEGFLGSTRDERRTEAYDLLTESANLGFDPARSFLSTHYPVAPASCSPAGGGGSPARPPARHTMDTRGGHGRGADGTGRGWVTNPVARDGGRSEGGRPAPRQLGRDRLRSKISRWFDIQNDDSTPLRYTLFPTAFLLDKLEDCHFSELDTVAEEIVTAVGKNGHLDKAMTFFCSTHRYSDQAKIGLLYLKINILARIHSPEGSFFVNRQLDDFKELKRLARSYGCRCGHWAAREALTRLGYKPCCY